MERRAPFFRQTLRFFHLTGRSVRAIPCRLVFPLATYKHPCHLIKRSDIYQNFYWHDFLIR